MANVIIDNSNLTAIGDAIRAKNGTTNTYKPREMADAITAIPTGSDNEADTALRESLVALMSNNTNALTEFVVPNGADRIIEEMFKGRTNLQSLVFEDINDITAIGANAFYQCTNLDMEQLPPNLEYLNFNAFEYCKNLTVSELPSGVTSIPSAAFKYCDKLEIDTIPDSVIDIGYGAFQYAYRDGNIPSMLTIGANVKTIANYAFADTNLTKVRFLGTPTDIENYSFQDTKQKLFHIYVPWGSSQAIPDVTTSAPWGAASATIHYNVSPDEVIE